MAGDLRDYAVEEILRDGGSIYVRSIRPDDRQRLLDHCARLSARSVYFRFFAAKRRLTDAELDYFTRLAFVQVALVAILLEGAEERIIRVGCYAMLAVEVHDGRLSVGPRAAGADTTV